MYVCRDYVLVGKTVTLTPSFPPPSYNVAGMFRAYYLAFPSLRLHQYTAHSATERGGRTGQTIYGVRFDALVQLLHCRGRLAESCLLKSNRFPHSGCWLAGPRGFLAGSSNLNNPAECRMALRLCLLKSPASLDVGDAEAGVLCQCNRRVCLASGSMHFFHCPSSQGQYIRRHDHIRDACYH